VIGFFNAYRDGQRVTRNRLRDIAEQFQNWVKNRCEKWGTPLLEAPAGRRDDFVDRFFRGTKTDQVIVILKAREPARTADDLVSCGQKWLACLTPFFKDSERKTCGCQHRRLVVSAFLCVGRFL
jgi:hypothetical protein